MRSATDTDGRLIPLERKHLPGWCDAYLSPPGKGDFFASRAWYDTLLAHGLPPCAAPVLALCGEGSVLFPLMLQDRRFASLTTMYSVCWRPLPAGTADGAALRAAGHGLAGLLRLHPPARLDAIDDGELRLVPVLSGLWDRGIATRRFRHFGNWRETLAPGLSWTGYLADRSPALRNTIQRKLQRAGKDLRFTRVTEAGHALDHGIFAYHAVRARSWKPLEPMPEFDAALMRAAAAVGALRLGVLRSLDGRPVAVQYWIVSGGQATLVKLAHDEADRALSPGTVLTAMMIRGLIEEGGVAVLDFGRGDDPYKQLWARQRRQRIGVVLTDPLHPAGLVELARQVVGQGRRSLRTWLHHAEVQSA